MEYRRWVTEGALLFAVPVAATTVAFAFESGYAFYFRIPAALITITWTSAALAFLALASLLLLLLSCGYVLTHQFASWTPWMTQKTALMLSAFVTLTGILLLQHGARSPAFLIGLALIVVDLLIDVLIRLIESRPLKGLWKRFREVSATGENADPLRSTVNRFVLVAMWFFVSLAAAWSTGYSRARDQRSFLVTDLSQEQVVLRRYGDVLLLADLDEERKVVSRHFTLESIGGDPSRIFVSANVGPLVSDAER